MTTLNARFQRAIEDNPTPRPTFDIIPYDCIRDYLQSHSLVNAFNIGTRDLHSAIIYVERHLQPLPEHHNTPSSAPVPTCSECHIGYMEIDAHNGSLVCSNCGLVPTRGSINIEREWVSEAPQPRGKRPRGIPGVPKWMSDQLMHDSRDAYNKETMDYLEHLNAYVGFTPDMLDRVHKTFLSWTDNGYCRNVKMAACMMHSVLKDQFLNEHVVREKVRKRSHIPAVHDPCPQPTFACPICGSLHYSKKEARFHCRYFKQ